jgi:hypothetical protein
MAHKVMNSLTRYASNFYFRTKYGSNASKNLQVFTKKSPQNGHHTDKMCFLLRQIMGKVTAPFGPTAPA